MKIFKWLALGYAIITTFYLISTYRNGGTLMDALSVGLLWPYHLIGKLFNFPTFQPISNSQTLGVTNRPALVQSTRDINPLGEIMPDKTWTLYSF